jgi:hypothetical protein
VQLQGFQKKEENLGVKAYYLSTIQISNIQGNYSPLEDQKPLELEIHC